MGAGPSFCLRRLAKLGHRPSQAFLQWGLRQPARFVFCTLRWLLPSVRVTPWVKRVPRKTCKMCHLWVSRATNDKWLSHQKWYCVDRTGWEVTFTQCSSSHEHVTLVKSWEEHETNPSWWASCKIPDLSSPKQSRVTKTSEKLSQPSGAWRDVSSNYNGSWMGSCNSKKRLLKAKAIWINCGLWFIMRYQYWLFFFPGCAGSLVPGCGIIAALELWVVACRI